MCNTNRLLIVIDSLESDGYKRGATTVKAWTLFSVRFLFVHDNVREGLLRCFVFVCN